jgi:hypothetical protein
VARRSPRGTELDRLLRAARADIPTAAEQVALRTAVFALVRSGVLPFDDLIALQSSVPTSLARLSAKLVGTLGVVAVVAVGVQKYRTRVPMAPAGVGVVNLTVASSPVASSESCLPERELQNTPVPSSAQSDAQAQPGMVPKTRQHPPTKAHPSEAALIDQAHRQLQTDPKGALALTELHRRLYPKGVLAQEREVIAIEALSRLGKSKTAEKRAGAFRANQPDSIHESRLRAVLGDAGVENP